MPRRWISLLSLAFPLFAHGQSTPAPAPSSIPTLPPEAYDAAKELWDNFAPDDVKQNYRFPSREEAQQAIAKIQAALDSGSLDDLAQYADQARQLAPVLQSIPGFSDYGDWLQSKLDELDAAKALRRAPAPLPPPHPSSFDVPFYREWVTRLRNRPAPAAAAELMPTLQAAFRAEGVPPQLAWLAEAESSLNSHAQSPAGAKGLFQLKSETARQYGLSTFLPDERTDPEKSAQAAARDLRELGHRFGSWPLALAAYNAGPGRVARLLAAHHADTFAAVAASLPGETRMYVPKVCALVALRSGVSVDRLQPPR
ncbi:MAG TPA: lytic transglycosylase domain-containing protein [Opitutaceae bacterium]|jgi:membrane-bound lytic murein transglycosylase D